MAARHHMDGAAATNDNRYNHNNSSPPQLDLNGTRHPGKEDNNNNTTNNNNNNNDNTINNNDTNGKPGVEDNHNGTSPMPMTTLKMKLPDVRQGGNTIQISLEVGGILYEGKISAKLPQLPPPVTTNGHYDVTTSEAEPINGENNAMHPRIV